MKKHARGQGGARGFGLGLKGDKFGPPPREGEGASRKAAAEEHGGGASKGKAKEDKPNRFGGGATATRGPPGETKTQPQVGSKAGDERKR